MAFTNTWDVFFIRFHHCTSKFHFYKGECLICRLHVSVQQISLAKDFIFRETDCNRWWQEQYVLHQPAGDKYTCQIRCVVVSKRHILAPLLLVIEHTLGHCYTTRPAAILIACNITAFNMHRTHSRFISASIFDVNKNTEHVFDNLSQECSERCTTFSVCVIQQCVCNHLRWYVKESICKHVFIFFYFLH